MGEKSQVQWKKSLIVFSIISILGITGFFIYQNGFSYQVSLNGEDIGFVKKVDTIEEAINIAEQDMIKKYGEDAYFDKKIETEKVRGHNDDLVDSAKLGEKISRKVEILKPASIIAVDGQEEIAVDSTEKAEAILEEIKKPYIENREDKNVEILDVSFNQKVEIIPKDVPVKEIASRSQALLALGGKSDKMQTYKVSRGDTAWNISRAFDMRVDAIEKANPGKDIEDLKPGDEINLALPKSLLEVVTVEKHKNLADVDFQVEEKEDPSIYRGETKVKDEGKKGKKEVVTEITFVNGVETKKDIVKETIIEEPKNKVVLVGTKERPRPVARSTSRSSTSRGTTTNNRPAPTYNGSLGAAIVSTAKQYLGIPYKYGGSTPAGFDCSGFTSYVYKQYGINIPRTSGGQGSYGARVSRSELRPGDIVVFPGHVGIYVGGGNFIHSPQTGKSIEIKSLNSSSYGKRFICGRRPY